jgi:hypothetical protein
MFSLILAACAPQPVATQNPPARDAIIWERSGGFAGICQRLTITFVGAYQLEDCAGERSLSAGELDAAQWEELAGLLERYTTFQYNFIPPQNSADMFTDSYTFNGAGSETPSPDEQARINERLAELAGQLAAGNPVVLRERSAPGECL